MDLHAWSGRTERRSEGRQGCSCKDLATLAALQREGQGQSQSHKVGTRLHIQDHVEKPHAGAAGGLGGGRTRRRANYAVVRAWCVARGRGGTCVRRGGIHGPPWKLLECGRDRTEQDGTGPASALFLCVMG